MLDVRVVVQENQPTSPTVTLAAQQVTRRRARSNTNPSISESRQKDAQVSSSPGQTAYDGLASAFDVIHSKYRVIRECAVLIELGGGNVNDELYSPPPPASASAPVDSRSTHGLGARECESGAKRGRERLSLLREMKPSRLNRYLCARFLAWID